MIYVWQQPVRKAIKNTKARVTAGFGVFLSGSFWQLLATKCIALLCNAAQAETEI